MTSLALIRLLTESARALGCAESTYIVGGAPRDCLLGEPVKDIDVVVEDKTGTIGPALSREVARRVGLRDVHPDQYGVVHVGPFPEGFVYHGVDLSRQKVEVVTARREKYDKSLKTGSHKPTTVEPGTIMEDLMRRDFTINTLMWRLSDVPYHADFSFEHIPVTDLLGGRVALEVGVIDTPLDPRETFSEDPSRILRAVRFRAKYGFQYTGVTEDALIAMAPEMRRLPLELLDGVLCDKIIPLPFEKMQSAFRDLSTFGLLPICLDMIPEARLRRVVDGLEDIRKEVFLLRHGFPSSLQKLPPQCRLWLLHAADRHPVETLQRARERFVKPPVDALAIASEFGLEGRSIGMAITLAREILGEDPFIEDSALSHRVRTSLRPGV